MAMDRLDALKVFAEVAKHQSFSATAGAMGMSAPSVTKTIAALEHRLGVKLFNRTTRIVRLTDSGAQFLADAKRIIEELAEAEAAVSGIYNTPSGTLRVTAPVLFGEKHVVPVIAEYLEQNIGVSVKAMFYDRVVNLLEEDLDIAIRIGHLKDSSFYATKVNEVRRVVCGAPSYFEEYGEPTHPSELIDHEIIFPPLPENNCVWHFENRDVSESVKVNPRLFCNHNSVAVQAAVRGRGITRLMSYQVGEEIAKGTLKRILIPFEEPPLPINLVYLEGRRTSAKIRSFIDLAAQRLGENKYLDLA